MNFYQLGFGYFAIKIYGVIFALTFLWASLHFFSQIKFHKMSQDFFIKKYWKIILSGVFIGRCLSIALNLEIFQKYGLVAIFAIWDGGINMYGFMLGAIVYAIYACKRRGEDLRKWLDLATPIILLSIVFIDFAGFLTGTIYGTESLWPWSVRYETFGVDTLSPVHPVGIYAMIIHICLWLWIKKHSQNFAKFPSLLTLSTVTIFFCMDFFLQFLRGDEVLIVFSSLRISQFFDLIIIFTSLIYLCIIAPRDGHKPSFFKV